MAEKQKLICDRCDVDMEEREIKFSYIGRSFNHKVMRCPKCGQVHLSDDLVNGRMHEVEIMMEEK